MAVGDVARFVGYDGLQLGGRGLVPDINRAEERERCDSLRSPYEREAVGAGDGCTPAEPADAHDLPQHDACDQTDAHEIACEAQDFGRNDGGGLFDHFGGPLLCGEGDRRGDLDYLARPDGDAQQRNEGRDEGRCEQVGPAPAEPYAPVEQDGVGAQQHAAAGEHFEGVDGEGFHGVLFFGVTHDFENFVHLPGRDVFVAREERYQLGQRAVEIGRKHR